MTISDTALSELPPQPYASIRGQILVMAICCCVRRLTWDRG